MASFPFPTEWAKAFFLTLLLESPVYCLALRPAFGTLRAFLVALAINLCSHPVFWTLTSGGDSLQRFLVAEVCVTLFEAAVLYALGRTRLGCRPVSLADALIVAGAANALSAGIGLLL